MTPDEVVARARQSIGHKCQYALGKGGMNPASAVPWDDEMECDCSGFACWSLGISRDQGGTWIGTDAIVADADLGKLFTKLPREQAQPGDLLVFPHRVTGHHGHVGVIAVTNASGPITVVHCSLGNWTHTGDAIRETDCSVFWLNGASVARLLESAV